MRTNNEQIWFAHYQIIIHEDNTIFMKFWFGNILLVVAANLTLTGIIVAHSLWTCCLLWITMGGQTLPIALIKVKTVLVSPWSAGTCLTKGFFTSPKNFSSLGTFCTPV